MAASKARYRTLTPHVTHTAGDALGLRRRAAASSPPQLHLQQGLQQGLAPMPHSGRGLQQGVETLGLGSLTGMLGATLSASAKRAICASLARRRRGCGVARPRPSHQARTWSRTRVPWVYTSACGVWTVGRAVDRKPVPGTAVPAAMASWRWPLRVKQRRWAPSGPGEAGECGGAAEKTAAETAVLERPKP